MSKAIHIYSSALKATLTWQNMITLQVPLSVEMFKHLSLYFVIRVTIANCIFYEMYQECREACGGQGLKTENRVGIFKAEFDVQSTFEGDNNVLMQQVIVVFSHPCIP